MDIHERKTLLMYTKNKQKIHERKTYKNILNGRVKIIFFAK